MPFLDREVETMQFLLILTSIGALVCWIKEMLLMQSSFMQTMMAMVLVI